MLQYQLERAAAVEAARERIWNAIASEGVTRPAFDSCWLLILTEFQGTRLFKLLSRWSRKPDSIQLKNSVLGLMRTSQVGRAALGLPPSSRTTNSAKKALWHMDEDVLEPVFLYAYTRSPKEFEDMLNGPALQHVRDRLASAGYAFRLDPSMAKVLVTPEQYPAVMEALQVWNHDYFKPWHVIVSLSLLHALEASIACILSKIKVKVKKNGSILVMFATRGGNS